MKKATHLIIFYIIALTMDEIQQLCIRMFTEENLSSRGMIKDDLKIHKAIT